MITKERLLAGLEELVYVEEGLITLYANFSKALVKETYGLGEDKKKTITALLSELYRDSARHKESLDNMAENITKSAANEY